MLGPAKDNFGRSTDNNRWLKKKVLKYIMGEKNIGLDGSPCTRHDTTPGHVRDPRARPTDDGIRKRQNLRRPIPSAAPATVNNKYHCLLLISRERGLFD